MQQQTVLLVDDDNFILKALSRILSPHYEVITASDGQEAYAQLEVRTPSLIVLDVEMPGENGYQVCTKIRANQSFAHIPIIFLSGNHSLEERIRGYEAGGDDYLPKPCDGDELVAKANIALKQTALNEKFSQAQQAAMNAMAGHSNMGILIKYVQAVLKVKNVDELGAWCIKACTQLSLNAVCSIRMDGEIRYFSSSGVVSPLEKELVNKLAHNGRFYDFGCRTQINYPNMSILVKNMPLDDEERYGRYKDLLPFIIEVTESRIQALSTSIRLHEQSDKLMRSVDATHAVFTSISRSLLHFQDSIQSELKKMYVLIEDKVPSLGLDDDQEHFILSTLDTSVEKITLQVEQSASFRHQLDNVEVLFSKLSDYNVQLETNMEQDAASTQDEEQTRKDLQQEDDVELF